jgi:hypothetical protein
MKWTTVRTLWGTLSSFNALFFRFVVGRGNTHNTPGPSWISTLMGQSTRLQSPQQQPKVPVPASLPMLVHVSTSVDRRATSNCSSSAATRRTDNNHDATLHEHTLMSGALRTTYMQEFVLSSWRSDCWTVQQSSVVRSLAGTMNRLVDILCHSPLFNVKRSHLATLAKTEIYLILEYKTLLVRYIHAMNSTIHIPKNQHAVVESDG